MKDVKIYPCVIKEVRRKWFGFEMVSGDNKYYMELKIKEVGEKDRIHVVEGQQFNLHVWHVGDKTKYKVELVLRYWTKEEIENGKRKAEKMKTLLGW